MPRLAVLSVLSAASSPCPDLKLIHYKKPNVKSVHTNTVRNLKRSSENPIFGFQTTFFKDCALQIKFSHNRRMVARAFSLARVQIDINVFQYGRQGGADELVVDAQSEFALEHCAAIVKPSVKRAFGMNLAQAESGAGCRSSPDPTDF